MDKGRMRKRVVLTHKILGAVLLILALTGLGYIAWLVGEHRIGVVGQLILIFFGSFVALFLGLRFVKFRFGDNDKD